MARQLVVEVTGNSKGFTRATEEATQAGNNLFKNAVTGFGMGAGMAIFNMASQAIGDLTTQVIASADTFREDQASASTLIQTMKDMIPGFNGNASAAEKFVSSMEPMGFTALDTRNALGQLLGVTHDLKKAEDLESEAAAFARAHHLDLATATDIVAKANEGNVKALKKYGIEILPVTKNVDALKASHTKYTAAQLEAAKAADRAATAQEANNAIVAQGKGQLEAYAQTSQGKLEAANARNTASWVKIGAIVARIEDAILPKVADAFEAVADTVAPLADWISNHLFPAFAQVGKFLQDTFGPDIKDITANFGSLVPVLKIIGIVIGVVFAIIVAVILIAIKVVLLLVKAIEWFAAQNEKNIDQSMKAWKAIGSTVSNIANGITTAWTNVVNFVKGLPGKITSAASGMWNGIPNAFRAALNLVAGMWSKLRFGPVPSWVPGIGGKSFSLPLLKFHEGGTVPGAPGSEVMALLQAGEHVSKRGESHGPVIHITIGTYVGDASTLSKMLAKELRLSGAKLR